MKNIANAALYARVSDPIVQDADDKVSIQEQLSDMRTLCKRNGWDVAAEFVDNEPYVATQLPSKGKTVNPSGERADRPKFLEMLELIRTGQVDAVLCWRDDRLVRHPRVAVALEDALDVGDKHRNGKGPIPVLDATGATIDRFTLSIKAAVWREENKRRAERGKMGKRATLQQGRWPGEFRRWGYKSVKIPGKRGRVIVEDPETAPIVRKIFEMYDAGARMVEIRTYLIANAVPQIYTSLCRHEWSKPLIWRILRSDEYRGKANWTFADGVTISVDIPCIIDDGLWFRVQSRLERSKRLSTRNAKGIYLLQGLVRCGDCGNGISVGKSRTATGGFFYRCNMAMHNPHEEHPRPASYSGPRMDWVVWRHIVDTVIRRPEFIEEQVRRRQEDLQTQDDTSLSEIARAENRLQELEGERAFYQRHAARGRITPAEFDARMEETNESQRHWQEELARLKELRDDSAKIKSSLDYARALLEMLQKRLDQLDQPPDELRKLPAEEKDSILESRRQIIRALCDRVKLYADGRVVIEGVIDGSEGVQFSAQGS